MTDSAPKATSQPPARPALDRRTLVAALIGATLALLVNAAVALCSNYLTRRDQHVQEADKCNDLAASLISTTSLARAAAQAAASTLSKPIPPGSEGQSFILPPIDEILHSQDQSLYIIDPIPRNFVSSA